VADTLTVGQAARELGLSETRVRELIAQGKLEAEITPLGRLISGASVESLKEARATR
jgi:excisionase family DNA binding protein